MRAERYQPAGIWESGVRRNFPAGPAPGDRHAVRGFVVSPTIHKGVLFPGLREGALQWHGTKGAKRLLKKTQQIRSRAFKSTPTTAFPRRLLRTPNAPALRWRSKTRRTFAGGFRPQGRNAAGSCSIGSSSSLPGMRQEERSHVKPAAPPPSGGGLVTDARCCPA
jgi:hypothetical protein